jgi:hypothetical protein
MLGYYLCDLIAGAGITMVINNHFGLAKWECIFVSFAITWFWGKS